MIWASAPASCRGWPWQDWRHNKFCRGQGCKNGVPGAALGPGSWSIPAGDVIGNVHTTTQPRQGAGIPILLPRQNANWIQTWAEVDIISHDRQKIDLQNSAILIRLTTKALISGIDHSPGPSRAVGTSFSHPPAPGTPRLLAGAEGLIILRSHHIADHRNIIIYEIQ